MLDTTREERMEIQTSIVEYASDGEKIRGFLAKPTGQGKFPSIIVIHEIWGLDEHIKDVTSRFAREEYVGLAVDLFGGRTFTDIQAGQNYVANLTDSRVMKNIGDAYAYLKTQSFTRGETIGVIGFCLGGRYSLLTACHNPDLKACIVFYGRPVNREINNRTPRHPVDLVENIRCPILGIFAEADQSIPPDVVNRLKLELEKHGKPHEIHIYPNAPHAFFNDTRPDRYMPEAARDAWLKTLRFFVEHLRVPEPTC